MEAPQGPGSPFVKLFDDDTGEGLDLPPEFHQLYGGWRLCPAGERPYTFTNFVVSRDGRVSFNEPGKSSGGPVSGYSPHDRWMMALLRARADAVLLGGTSFNAATRHVWTPEAVFPGDAATWSALRTAEGRQPIPVHVVVTRTGNFYAQSPVILDPTVPTLVATTAAGIARARELAGDAPNVQILGMGESIDFPALLRLLAADLGVRTLLSEAGPQVYGALIESHAVDDEFLTLSPIVVGNSAHKQRPSLVENSAFLPDTPPRTRLLSLRRAGDYLFMHSRYTFSRYLAS